MEYSKKTNRKRKNMIFGIYQKENRSESEYLAKNTNKKADKSEKKRGIDGGEKGCYTPKC